MSQPSPVSSNQTHNNTQSQVQKAKEQNPHNNIVVYVLGLITLGAAFGNMFAAGRLRRKPPTIPTFDADSSFKKFQEQATKQQARRASQQANGARYNRDGSKFKFEEEFAKHQQQSGMSSSWTTQDRNLTILGLKRHQCNEAEIKKAFFAMAKLYHPDTFPPDLSRQEKDFKIKKFQQINEAYQELLNYVKMMDQAGTHP